LKKGFISIKEYNEVTSTLLEKNLQVNDDDYEEGEGNFFVDEDLPLEFKDLIVQRMKDEKLIPIGMSEEIR
jgi:hypothetical protein